MSADDYRRQVDAELIAAAATNDAYKQLAQVRAEMKVLRDALEYIAHGRTCDRPAYVAKAALCSLEPKDAGAGIIPVKAWVLRSDEHGLHWHRLMFIPADTRLNEHWNPDNWVRVPSLDTVIADPGVDS